MIFIEKAGKFYNSEKSSLLIPNKEGSLYSFALRSGEDSYQAWSNLYEGMLNSASSRCEPWSAKHEVSRPR
ncbi:hypothetical protein AVI52_09965 [Piscirickettsia salmonis]|nr:hypothetical protein AVI52_09965 [Piscirickettsia salmonis]